MDWEKEGFARGISGKNVRALWMRRRPIPARRSFEATIFQFFYSLLPLKKLKKKREEWFQWAESRATEKKTERSRTGFIRLEELMMSSPLDEPRRGVGSAGMMEVVARGGAREAVETVAMEDRRAWSGGGSDRQR
ncbi:hypothetical protein CRG98_047214 [Punica granatum]|uniref:Uncharacterized protein n=1 Tax=Punica granatum TaxID=22663 RepID=A0A2I0HL09_PUNGR|nr:hypothetical protein CRG98_047214 [Punica granatum]